MPQKHIFTILSIIIFLFGCQSQQGQTQTQDWTHYIHTTGNGLSIDNVDEIIAEAETTHVYGIEVDNDVPGRYPSFLDPTQKLTALEKMAEQAHAHDNYAFVYVAGLECITPNVEDFGRSFFRDHPDWVQRDINGNPAIFDETDAFWIDEGEEDVWISPYAPEWRKIYMKRIRQIAQTGIDGIYVDIPYWMTHFDGWTDTWASFDQYTVEEFRKRTGLDAKTDLNLGDFSDANFREWVKFRIETLTEFMAEIDSNVKAVNPEAKTIAEIYPGIGEEAVRVGADVYQMYEVVDAIAHEYSAGGYTAAEREPFDWFTYMTGMYTFRAFAEEKPSWMLSYSWDENEPVSISESMHNMFASHVMAGLNTWDARGHVMSGSNDFETRTAAYQWIAENRRQLYAPRKPLNPVGVYFSPQTRNFFPESYTQEFNGIMHLILQGHLPFQILTPRTLDQFEGEVLLLPDAKMLSSGELSWLGEYIQSGKTLVITGETGEYDANRNRVAQNPLSDLLGEQIGETGRPVRGEQYVWYKQRIGASYFNSARAEFNRAAQTGAYSETDFYRKQQTFLREITSQLGYTPDVRVKASPFVATQITEVQGNPTAFLTNFSGLVAKKNAKQIPAEEVEISFAAGSESGKVMMQEYLGDPTELETEYRADRLVCKLPAFRKAAIVWLE
ncbi:MAG: hypothetical protein K9N46_08890 [Candidatus Marinimicrobia bacterium]|nr:hypothetical protein [Candidatus Neomarinimicrobiota bacterium]MCF7830223.1 hypothetical protein [Candidatus Neomarinimicrobiota bacterium]MCF7880840.1 hypothetical protein [Candidatus Neomarinimicrobiota bacterium]